MPSASHEPGPRVRQNVDIWSLGCIYSEAACWIKYGSHGVEKCRRERRADTSKIAGLEDTDCFHDGEKVLQAVLGSHAKSKTNLRPEDTITEAVITTMVTDMLALPVGRRTASGLC